MSESSVSSVILQTEALGTTHLGFINSVRRPRTETTFPRLLMYSGAGIVDSEDNMENIEEPRTLKQNEGFSLTNKLLSQRYLNMHCFSVLPLHVSTGLVQIQKYILTFEMLMDALKCAVYLQKVGFTFVTVLFCLTAKSTGFVFERQTSISILFKSFFCEVNQN